MLMVSGTPKQNFILRFSFNPLHNGLNREKYPFCNIFPGIESVNSIFKILFTHQFSFVIVVVIII